MNILRKQASQEHSDDKVVKILNSLKLPADLVIKRKGRKIYCLKISTQGQQSIADRKAAQKQIYVTPDYQLNLALKKHFEIQTYRGKGYLKEFK